MRSLILCVCVLAGCARAEIRVVPASAKLYADGRMVGIGQAMIATTKAKPVLVRAEQDGFRPACALVENRHDTTLYLARSEPDERPFPGDAEILGTWTNDRVNLCMARETTATEPAPVLVTAGDLSRPYEIFG
jgi:hypothetical protein